MRENRRSQLLTAALPRSWGGSPSVPSNRTSPVARSERKAESDTRVSCVQSRPRLRQVQVRSEEIIASARSRGAELKRSSSYAIGPFSRK
jgi:hypothetical protein